MKHRSIVFLAAALLLVSCSTAEPMSDNVSPTLESRTAAEEYTSPSSVFAAEDGTVYATDETGGRVIKWNADGTVAAQLTLDGGTHCVKLHDDRVYVTRGGLDGTLTVLSTDLKLEHEYSVGHTPTDVEFIGTTAFVTNRFSNTVSLVDLTDGSVRDIAVGREPMAAAVVGSKLYVACHLPDDAANADVVSASVYVYDTANTDPNGALSVIELVNGMGSVKDIEVTPDGERVLVSAIVARYQYPTTQLDGAWINSNGFAVIDARSDEYVTTVLLDDVTLGAASPWGIAFDDENAYLALSGTGEIMSFPLSGLDDILSSAKGRELADEIGILNSIRTRTSLPGEGVRDIMYRDGRLYCTEYFTGDIAVVDTETLDISTLSSGEQPAADAVRLGETLWYDATKCYQNWEACASCHPDGRADGFNWDNLNDGLGNPKSAASMLFSHRCPPVMATGIRADAETAVRSGMKFIQFNTIDESSSAAIDEYLKATLPTDSPSLELDGTLSEAAVEGEALFEQYGCVECHPAPLYTDLEYHTSPVLGNDGGWESRDFVTPTLVEVWRTAPYMYNGSARTLEEAVRAFVPEETSDEDVAKLTAFVSSIGTVGEDYGVEQVFSVTAEGQTVQGRPTVGATLERFTVRCQTSSAAPCYARVTVDGVELGRFSLGEMAYSTAVTVDLTGYEAVMSSGSELHIELIDKKGEPLASEYILKVR